MIGSPIIIGILILLLMVSCYHVIKSEHNSMCKVFIKFLLREMPIILALLTVYMVYNYLYLVFYNKIGTWDLLYKVFIDLNNLAFSINNIIGMLIRSFITEENIRVLLIGLVVLMIIRNENLKDQISLLMQNIQEFTLGNMSVKLNEKKETEIRAIMENKETGNDKNRLKALLVDNEIIATYVYKFINGSKMFRVPKSKLGEGICLAAIEEFFDYNINATIVTLKGLRKDRAETIKEIFNELQKDEIIYIPTRKESF